MRSHGLAAHRIVILVLATFILVSGVADLRRLWQPIGVYGTIAGNDGVVQIVAPGSPADRAGIRPGDRFDIARMPAQWRWFLFPLNCTDPGERITVGVIRGNQERPVTMVSVPEPMGTAERTAIITSVIAGVVSVFIGAITVLLRPTTIAWGFYLFCLGVAPFTYRDLDATLRMPGSYVWLLTVVLVGAAALPGLLVFSANVLSESISRSRAWISLSAPFFFVIIAAFACTGVVETYMLGTPAAWTDRVDHYLALALTILIAVVLGFTYFRAGAVDRQRLRWMLVGLGIALALPYLRPLLALKLASNPALYDVLAVVGAGAPLGVAYAILKHRVVNISFVVSRTLVYAVITGTLIGVFALIDWLVAHVLEQSRLAVIVEVMTAVAMGFWINAIHRRVDSLVDGVLFRARHVAERTLTRIATGLPHATSFDVVDESLTGDTSAALDLASSALFRRTAGYRFDRMSSEGWSEGSATLLDERDRLAMQLQGERKALRLSEARWNRTDLPGGVAEPVLALPIFVRHQLDAILILGAHRSGEDFNAGELTLLQNIATAAGAAYDHLEADALRERTAELQRTVERLRATLQAHGLLSAL